ncbi:peptidase domain-containing ABC transporter [uncultured Zoogloea sp.]|uniref:peptidase domain-containing ABC transporter n=1 Tax=uncultured Zoogloea sp. TaxID=160237 RepID=UPI0026016270|nr:peptidase domain-containing ABC transporter [uncultured Zoogloea sp.]
MTERLRNLRFSSFPKVREILQSEAAECGLACLAMCASANGYDVSLDALRRRFPVSLKGGNLKMLVDIAAAIDLAARPLQLEASEIGELQTPCILHWDMRHFVVLVSFDGKVATIQDPAVGRRKVTLSELGKHFTGVALELTPTPAFKPRRERPQIGFADLLGKVRGLRASLVQIGLLSLALEVLSIVMPWINQWIIDDVVVTMDLDLLNVLALAMLLFGATQAAIRAFRSWAVVHLGTQMNLQWMSNVFGHLLQLPMSFFEKRHLGDVVSRLRSTTELQKALTQGFVEAILDGIMALLALTVMLFYSTTLTLIVSLAAALYTVLLISAYRSYRIRNEEVVVRSALADSYMMESIRGVQCIKLFNFQNTRRARWLNLQVDAVNASIQIRKLDIFYQLGYGVIAAAENALVIWLATHLILDKKFTIGMLLAFITYKSQFLSRSSALVDRLFQYRLLNIQRDRLADIVLTPVESGTQIRQPLTTGGQGCTIELRDVWYRYGEGESWTLQGVNLTIAPGESITVLGPSGCGKTTLVKIILGILEPTRGEVLVDGTNLARIQLDDYRRRLATVMQEDRLFSGSVLDNVSFFDEAPDMARVRDCLAAAAVLHEIDEMPMGAHTLVGDMGTTLSAGQGQRVLFARALYKQPEMLLMDEATSFLDVDNQTRIRSWLEASRLTRISITHRIEMVSPRDRVFRMEGGKLHPGSG